MKKRVFFFALIGGAIGAVATIIFLVTFNGQAPMETKDLFSFVLSTVSIVIATLTVAGALFLVTTWNDIDKRSGDIVGKYEEQATKQFINSTHCFMPKTFHKHKILLDENMHPRTRFPRLNSRFDVKHIREDLKRGGITDAEIYQLAVKQNRVLLTYNTKHFCTLAGTLPDTGIIGVSAHLTTAQVDTKLTRPPDEKHPPESCKESHHAHRRDRSVNFPPPTK
jgi:predicted nuclease of predicted toxin-antitoxin system